MKRVLLISACAVVFVAGCTNSSPEATSEFSLRPVLGVHTSSPALADPSADHPAGLDRVTGLSIADDAGSRVYFLDEDESVVYDLGVAILSGADITDAKAHFVASGNDGGEWVVVPTFTSLGGHEFREATKRLASYPEDDVRRQVAIVVDRIVISAPVLSPEVDPTEGLDPNAVVITIGQEDGDKEVAEDLVAALLGSIPVTSEQQISGDCVTAFSEVASIDRATDAMMDFYPAMRSCESVEEWVAVSAIYPGTLDDLDPVEWVVFACQTARQLGDFDIAQSPLCQSVND